MSLIMLNKDLLQYVGEYLSSADLSNLLVLSKQLHRIFSCENYWKRKVMHEYPEEAAVAETMTYRKLYFMMDGMPPQLKKIFAEGSSRYQNLSDIVQKISSCAIQEQLDDEDDEHELYEFKIFFIKRELPLRMRTLTITSVSGIPQKNYYLDRKNRLAVAGRVSYQFIPEEEKAFYNVNVDSTDDLPMNIEQFSKWKDEMFVQYRPIFVSWRGYGELIKNHPRYFSVRIENKAPQGQCSIY